MRRWLSLGLPLALTFGCATTRLPTLPPSIRIEVLAAMDRVPVTAHEALLPVGAGADEQTRRLATMLAVAGDLAAAVSASGATVCEGLLPEGTGGNPDPQELARLGREDGVDVVVLPELIAYGQVRHSWLWLLAAQGLVAGIGHGVVVAKATGSAATGWWLGAGEFALETVTWVGGALVASRIIDPVIVRVWAVRTSDGSVIGRWTREGTSPVRSLLHRSGLPPRGERLRGVSAGIFTALAPKLLSRVAREVSRADAGRAEAEAER